MGSERFLELLKAQEMQVYLSTAEVLMCFVIFVVNFYGVIAIVTVKELHQKNFYLVNLQTIIDCVFLGFVGMISKTLLTFGRMNQVCFTRAEGLRMHLYIT